MSPLQRPPDPAGVDAEHGSGITLRWAGPNDAANLAALQSACRVGSPGHEAWSVSAWQDLLSQPSVLAVLAATEAGEPAGSVPCSGGGVPGLAGFALVRIVLDEAELFAIGVVPDKRRLGIATVILKAIGASATLLGAEKLFLEVAESNATARAFYESQGFQVIGERAGYYRNSAALESAIVMWCQLVDGKVVHPKPKM